MSLAAQFLDSANKPTQVDLLVAWVGSGNPIVNDRLRTLFPRLIAGDHTVPTSAFLTEEDREDFDARR